MKNYGPLHQQKNCGGYMVNSVVSQMVILVRRTIYFLCYFFDAIVGRKSSLIIFCLHDIGSSSFRFCQDPIILDKQLSLVTKRFKVITLSDLYHNFDTITSDKTSKCIITFDDGYTGVYVHREILRKYNIKPTVFFLTGNQKSFPHDMQTFSYCTKKEIESIKNLGWDIGSHGVSHKDHRLLTDDSVNLEITQSKKYLESVTQKCYFYAYPHGKYTDKIVDMVKDAGYKLALSMDDEDITSKSNTYKLSRVGIDKTHGIEEILWASTPSAIMFRRLVKRTFLGKYL